MVLQAELQYALTDRCGVTCHRCEELLLCHTIKPQISEVSSGKLANLVCIMSKYRTIP